MIRSLILFFICVFSVSGDLKVTNSSGLKCGTKICQVHDYCSAFDYQCYPCANICNEKTHNFDPTVCARDCQEYIHDSRYVRRDDASPVGKEDLRATVQRLQYTLTVTLTLLIIVIVFLLICGVIQTWKWKKNNNVTLSTLGQKLCFKKSNSNSSKSSDPKQSGEKPDLRIDMPSPGTHPGDHSPVTMTTSISRRPAEDSALDYAYDNRGMANTPSPR